ncbi:hypothetical protein VNO77_21282 [Canavalia gladiata]|uniref:Uncharacterized protein n=1 Tax=Canavalia gladiata TaxID=3824 RepID=A0AAN9LQS8_CANGL
MLMPSGQGTELVVCKESSISLVLSYDGLDQQNLVFDSKAMCIYHNLCGSKFWSLQYECTLSSNKIRKYLICYFATTFNPYDWTMKLRSKSPLFESHSNQQYVGRFSFSRNIMYDTVTLSGHTSGTETPTREGKKRLKAKMNASKVNLEMAKSVKAE